jgi:hypothetical protein
MQGLAVILIIALIAGVAFFLFHKDNSSPSQTAATNPTAHQAVVTDPATRQRLFQLAQAEIIHDLADQSTPVSLMQIYLGDDGDSECSTPGEDNGIYSVLMSSPGPDGFTFHSEKFFDRNFSPITNIACS